MILICIDEKTLKICVSFLAWWAWGVIMNSNTHRERKETATMTNSELFKKAHSMTRQTIAKHPDSDYQYTFGAALKAIKQAEKMRARLDIGEFLIDSGCSIILSGLLAIFMSMTFYIAGYWIAEAVGGFIGVIVAFTLAAINATIEVIAAYHLNTHMEEK